MKRARGMDSQLIRCFEFILRWILKILHDPKDLLPWELWYYSILGSCRIFSIHSILRFQRSPQGAPWRSLRGRRGLLVMQVCNNKCVELSS